MATMVRAKYNCNSSHTNMNANAENAFAFMFVGERVWMRTKETATVSEDGGEVDEATALAVRICRRHRRVSVWREG